MCNNNAQLEQEMQEFCAHFGQKLPENLYEVFFRNWEKQVLIFALNQCQNNQSAAARLLGLNRNTLRKKLISYQLLEKQ